MQHKFYVTVWRTRDRLYRPVYKISIGGKCSIVTVIKHCDQQFGGYTSTEKRPQAIIIIIISSSSSSSSSGSIIVIIIIILFVEYNDCHQKVVHNITWIVWPWHSGTMWIYQLGSQYHW
jgi:hypothetical protein